METSYSIIKALPLPPNIAKRKSLAGRLVNAPNFGSGLRHQSGHDSAALHCTEPFIITFCHLSMASEMLRHQTIIIITYQIYHTYSDRWAWTNSVGPDEPASVAQLDAASDWRPEGRGFNPCLGRQRSFVEIDHEIFSTVILSLPLIQEGQLSVSGERMCTILVNRLKD